MIDDTVEPGRPLGGAAEDVPVPVVLAAELVEDDVRLSIRSWTRCRRAYFPRRIFGVCCFTREGKLGVFQDSRLVRPLETGRTTKKRLKKRKVGNRDRVPVGTLRENGLESVGAGAFDYADEYAGVEDNLLDDHLRSGVHP